MIIENKQNAKKQKKMLLHVCCAPCSSHVLSVLYEEYDITAFFYNPNITEKEEYEKRIEELKRFTQEAEFARDVSVCDGEYEETARYAKEHGFDIFTTTLSISPHKNAAWLNEIGERMAEKYGVSYLYSDFKKKNGYAHSIELSREYHLYRQDYCGCIYSRLEREEQKKNKRI